MPHDPTPSRSPLPIDAVLGELGATLAARSSAVLVAPPGAGKTTRVPLVLLDAGWLGDGRILVLEPRRLAARGAAERMARTLGERVGQRVGLRARLDTRVGPGTRIEVVTEGVFTRLILDDPALEGVGAVLLDEFHERSLDADLALALALDTQAALRPDLRLLVMSATLDHARVADLLGAAPVISCEGRSFPVETRYLGRSTGERIEDQVAAAVALALDRDGGSILAFLPGQAEIRRVAERLMPRIADPGVDVAPLYGGLSLAEQDRAVAPAPAGRRKVVLATSIAETSLTIEGVRVVIDCGLARVPRYEPGSGLTRLETVRVSRAAADQRRGRAGRLEPGLCYRLWSERETQSLPAFAEPEMRAADLSGLLLDCAAWGVTDPLRLSWLDPPPAAALSAARQELAGIAALDVDGRLTALGRRVAELPLPPRLAVMLLRAARMGQGAAAAEIAAILVEHGLGGSDTDLGHRLAGFRADRGRRAEDMRRLARQWARLAAASPPEAGSAPEANSAPAAGWSPAALLALAYPDRIARARDRGRQYLLANGRGASLRDGDPLSRSELLVVADMAGSAAAAHIRLAAPLQAAELEACMSDRVVSADEITFDAATASVRRRHLRKLGAIVLSAAPRPVETDEVTAQTLLDGILGLGVDRLPWSRASQQVRARVAFLRRLTDASAWPDLGDEALVAAARDWLLPLLAGKASLSQIAAEDLHAALETLLPWDLRRKLDAAAPTHFTAATGNRHPIRYSGPNAPVVALKIGEMFGTTAHPLVAGRLPLTLELLSPAQRPLAITSDIVSFWQGAYKDVRSEMKGRYPKHPWPEEPDKASPMTGAKPRPRG